MSVPQEKRAVEAAHVHEEALRREAAAEAATREAGARADALDARVATLERARMVCGLVRATQRKHFECLGFFKQGLFKVTTSRGCSTF